MMKENILIVEDEFIVANDLRLMLTKNGYDVCGIAASVQEARRLVEKQKPTWVLLDIFLQEGSMGIDLAGFLTEKNIGFIYISANTNQSVLEAAKATQPYGFLVKPFREKELLIMLDIAREKHQGNLQFVQQRELILQKQLESILAVPGADDKLAKIPGTFQALIPFDLMKLNMLKKRDVEEVSFIRIGFDEYQQLKDQELPALAGSSQQEIGRYKPVLAGQDQKGWFNEDDYRKSLMDDPWEKKLAGHFQLASKLIMPLTLSGGDRAQLTFYSRKAKAYAHTHLHLLNRSERSILALFEQLLRQDRNLVTTKTLASDVQQFNTRQEISNNRFDGIIGNSPSLLQILDNIKLAAPAQISVLILGESGTGKERIAQCIHKLSPRKTKPIITVNCAAMPLELIESELFGHEKGAFTGATDKRIGKFELADGGTIFLDEIGELPLDSQVKLLRVLQEKEIEHVGGSKTIKVDVRIIAATNKKLEKEVAEGRFRLDLYYRLNVFPIELPPLRERKADIGLLAQHFVSKYSPQMGKNISGLSKGALAQLESYNWPGNIRELEHLIERSTLLAEGPQITYIQLPTAEPATEQGTVQFNDGKLKTLEEMEAQHILNVLRNCNGKVCGMGGAAEILGLPPSTLNSKIKKLGIKRESYFNQ